MKKASFVQLAIIASDLGVSVAEIEADARALWAVRVLDAYTVKMPAGYSPPVAMPAELLGQGWVVFVEADPWFGDTPDAARIAAATALVAADPSLDPDK